MWILSGNFGKFIPKAVPDFYKLPYSLRSQGDNMRLITLLINWVGFVAIARWMWGMIVRWLSWWLRKLVDLINRVKPFAKEWHGCYSKKNACSVYFQLALLFRSKKITFKLFVVGEQKFWACNCDDSKAKIGKLSHSWKT